MTRRRSFCVAALGAAITLSMTGAGWAAERRGVPDPVDARVRLLFEHRDKTGRTLPFYVASPAFEASGQAPLLVRWKRALTDAERRTYKKLGVRMGRTLTSGATKIVAREEAVAKMVADGVLLRAMVDLRPMGTLSPLDLSNEEIGVPAVNATIRKMTGAGLTGKGVIVGDLDSSADPFHPAFFAPLPPVPWLDADGDGALKPGVDGVDLDGDGALADSEILRHLDGRADGAGGLQTDIYGTDDDGFNPGWDYLYIDADGDGARSVGKSVGGAETKPGMGEPVFAAEDIDGDGVIAVSERLIPLGASKFRAIKHGGVTYSRGKNLATYPPTSPGDNGRHATQVLSVVAGGQVGVSRFLGLAPEAELVLDTFTEDIEPHTDKVQWLADQGAGIIVTELGLFGTEPSDGSTELELMMDSVVDQGVLVVSPAGNLGLSTKHALGVIPASSSGISYTNTIVSKGGPSPTYVFVSVTWLDGSVGVGGSLTSSDGDALDLDNDVTDATTAQGRSYSVAHGVTSKGAGYLLVAFTASDAAPAENMSLSLKSTVDQAVPAKIYILDTASGWTKGLQWSSGDVDGCMVVPSFASKTIAVGAYALHTGPAWAAHPEASGQLRGYSGRGPDLFGDPGIDIASPDNPVTAHPDVYPFGSTKGEGITVRWREFGGTSGAGPGVAGVAALKKQASPGVSASALRSSILEAARVDADVMQGTEAMWGAGKVDLGILRATGAPPTPTLKIQAPAGAAPGADVKLVASVMDDGDIGAAKARWDIGYDGTWDFDYASDLSVTAAMPAGGPLDVKVEVMDADGWIGRASARIEVAEVGSGGAGGAGGNATGAGGNGAGGSPGAGGNNANGQGTDGTGCACEIAAGSDRDRSPARAPLTAALPALAALALARRRRHLSPPE